MLRQHLICCDVQWLTVGIIVLIHIVIIIIIIVICNFFVLYCCIQLKCVQCTANCVPGLQCQCPVEAGNVLSVY
jgi:hypothetical protein